MKRSARRSDKVSAKAAPHWREAIPNDRLAHIVKESWRSFVRALQVRLNRHGIPFGHWAFLRILWETDGLMQRELSSRAGVMEPTTFAALKTMQRQGYVTRRRMRGNKRKLFVYLTPKGRSLKAKLVPLAEAVNEVAVGGLKLEDVATTRRVLLAAIENLAKDEDDQSGGRRRKRTATKG